MVLPRNNPFRSECIDRLPIRLQGIDWEALVARWRESGWRGSIVGPEGHGKSTLLRSLRDWWEGQGGASTWLQMAFQQRRLTIDQARAIAQAAPASMLFVDSLEQLDWLGWRQLRRLAMPFQGIIATSHRPGRLPTLVKCATSAELLQQLVAELLGTHVESSQSELATLFTKHRGNIRDCLRDLFDQYAAR